MIFTKIKILAKTVIKVLQQNSDDERCLQKSEKLANFEKLKVASFKISYPDSVGVNNDMNSYL